MVSTEYLILLHDNEVAWRVVTAAQRAETYARHWPNSSKSCWLIPPGQLRFGQPFDQARAAK